jgi:hypothetical protein
VIERASGRLAASSRAIAAAAAISNLALVQNVTLELRYSHDFIAMAATRRSPVRNVSPRVSFSVFKSQLEENHGSGSKRNR